MQTLDLGTSLVVLASLSQIGLLSFLLPHRERARFRLLAARYPSSEYPLAYTVTGQRSDAWHRGFQRVMWSLGVVGIAVLLFGLYRSYGAFELGVTMYGYMLVQILPWVISGPRFVLVHRALRKLELPTVRHAELRPRRITDYVPAWQIGVAFGAQLVFVVTCYFAFPKRAEPAFFAALPLVIINLLLVLRMLYRMRGSLSFRRADPYMSAQDRQKVGGLQVNQLVRMSTVFGLLSTVVLLLGNGSLHFDRVYPIVGLSVLMQIGFLRLSMWMQKFYAGLDLSDYRNGAQPPLKAQAGTGRSTGPLSRRS